MKTQNQAKAARTNKKRAKYVKPVATAAVVIAVALVAAAVILPRALNTEASSKSTVYQVQELTYGNVSATVSGSGTLTPKTQETLTSEYGGEVESVSFKAGDTVSDGDVIAVIENDDGDEEITAPCDGVLTELPIGEGDDVARGGSVASVMGKDGFTLGIAVDELNISSVSIGQEVSFTIDAVDGDYTGKVADISYNGSSSGGTTAYQVTVAVDYIDGVYPGMSAAAEIVVEDSGEGLLAPVDAVVTSGDENYIYLAPSGAQAGTSYEEDELDLSELTKVAVETGMSDGSYMLVKSDELAEGSLIICTQVTSTLTGSESEEEGGSAPDMGGFPGGDFDFSDFDFENFDPSQMPQGGFSQSGAQGGSGND